MKHGFPESPTELCEFRTKSIKSAIKALEKCLIFNDLQVTSLIYAALEYLNIAKLLVDHENETTLRLAEIEKESAQCASQGGDK